MWENHLWDEKKEARQLFLASSRGSRDSYGSPLLSCFLCLREEPAQLQRGPLSMGKDCWLPRISFRISSGMRAVRVPVALVLSGTIQREWGQGEVCKNNYSAMHTASLQAWKFFKCPPWECLPLNEKALVLTWGIWFLVNSLVLIPPGTRIMNIHRENVAFWNAVMNGVVRLSK